ncbi:MAG: hypothetical protein V1859_00715 [archaeon]
MIELSINMENNEFKMAFKSISKEEKRKILLEYVKKIYETEKRYVSKREIRIIFHVELYNYFKDVFEMHALLGIEVPLEYMPRDYAINKILGYVKMQAEKGIYPSKNDIEKKFNVHIYTYFSGIEDVYEKSGVDYSKFKEVVHEASLNSEEKNESIKQKIIEYLKQCTSQGYYPSSNKIQKKI